MQNDTVKALLVASQQLLAEDEQATAKAVAKQAKMERQKAKKRPLQQEQEQQQEQQHEQQSRMAATDACAVEAVQASMVACMLPEQQQLQLPPANQTSPKSAKLMVGLAVRRPPLHGGGAAWASSRAHGVCRKPAALQAPGAGG